MALYDASVAKFYMTDEVGENDISPYIISIDGLPGTRTLLPATTINDTGRKSHPGTQQADIRMELLWSDDALVGPHTVFSNLFEDTTPRAFRYGPEGAAVGAEKISGTALLRLLNEPTRVGTMQTCIVELEVQGKVALGVFP